MGTRHNSMERNWESSNWYKWSRFKKLSFVHKNIPMVWVCVLRPLRNRIIHIWRINSSRVFKWFFRKIFCLIPNHRFHGIASVELRHPWTARYQTSCECVRSDAAVFLMKKKPFETNHSELWNSGETVSRTKEAVCSFKVPAKRHPPEAAKVKPPVTRKI